MQPRLPQRRPIRTDARPDVPLVYERLSDPILVTRAKAGDQQALEALCERHAPRVERLALHLLRDPEDARDAAQDSLAKLVVRDPPVPRRVAVLDLAPPARRSTPARTSPRRARSRRTEPLFEDERPARDGDPVAALTASETRRELGRRLAELPPAQATVVALKDAFDVGFAEISEVTGLPVGTAKCYAHRGRASLRERLTA